MAKKALKWEDYRDGTYAAMGSKGTVYFITRKDKARYAVRATGKKWRGLPAYSTLAKAKAAVAAMDAR